MAKKVLVGLAVLVLLVTGVIQQRIAQKVITHIDLLRRGGIEGAVDALKGLLK